MYKIPNKIVKKISKTILEDPTIDPDIACQDASTFIEGIIEKMVALFNIPIEEEETANMPDKLVTLAEIEAIYRKQKKSQKRNIKNAPKMKILKTLIDDIMDNQWDKITAEDLCSFFLPIFKSDYIKNNKEYFQDLEEKLYLCLEYYSMVYPNGIRSYLTEDIRSFINCVYYQEKVPTRDYKKLLEILESGEI